MRKLLQLGLLLLLSIPVYANPQPTGLSFIDNIFAFPQQQQVPGVGASFNPASPGPIGGTTPNTGTFTTVTANNLLAPGNTASIYLSPDCPTTNANGSNCYFANANAKALWTCTWTTGGVVTCPSGTFSQADVGKIAFATGQLPGGSNSNSTGGIFCAQSTIATVSGSTGATLASGSCAVASVSALYPFIYGTDDTSNITAAWNAAIATCSNLFLPNGNMINQAAQFTNLPTKCGLSVGADRASVTVSGVALGAAASNIILTPNFNFTGCTSGYSAAACFGGKLAGQGQDIGGANFQNLSINGYGVSPTGCNGITGVEVDSNNWVFNSDFMAWCGDTANATGIYVADSVFSVLNQVQSDGFGIVGLYIANSYALITGGSYFGDNAEYNAYFVGSTTEVHSSGTSYGACNTAPCQTVTVDGALYYGDGDKIFAGTPSVSLTLLDSGATSHLVNGNFITSTANSTAIHLSTSGNALYLENTNVQAVASGALSFNTAAGTTVYDLGGNTCNSTASNTISGSFLSITGNTESTVCVLPVTGTGSVVQAVSPAITGAPTVTTGNNAFIINCALTSATTCLTTGETTAATTGGAVEHQITTLTTSAAIPLQITQGANGPSAANAPAVINVSAAAAGGVAAATGGGFTGSPITLLTGAGSAAGATSGAGGTGGAYGLTTGAGGAGSATTGNGGIGGAYSLTVGNGGAAGGNTANSGGAGGAITDTSGTGAQGAATGPGGAAGNIGINGGVGGRGGATSGTGGTGGSITLTAGAGGVATAGSTTGAGGIINLVPGAAGATGTAGLAGVVQFGSGAPSYSTLLTSSTSWTSPANLERTSNVKITMVGGGNAGGTSAAATIGLPGGAGCTIIMEATAATLGLVANTAYTYAIGSASGGSTTFNNGTSTNTASGGTAGSTLSSAAIGVGLGGVGGACTVNFGTTGTNTIAIPGQPGTVGEILVITTTYQTGTGGSTIFGSGGQPVISGVVGNPGTGYGAGGSGGGVGTHAGGAGTAGAILIEITI